MVDELVSGGERQIIRANALEGVEVMLTLWNDKIINKNDSK